MLAGLSSVRSPRTALIASIAAAACMLTFKVLESQINAISVEAGFKGPATELAILDMRFGYSPEQVARLLEAWGPRGRLLYSIIELVDMFCYFPAYGALFLVIINRLARGLVRRGWSPSVQQAYLAVVLLIALDVVEDTLQLLLVNTYQPGRLSDPQWIAMVQSASVANVAKWWTVRFGTFLTLGMLAAALLGR